MVGEMRALEIADGSTIQLNTDTAIAIDITDRYRRVEIYRGEAFFSVASDRDRPFEVIAGAGRTRALGTAFNVNREARTVAVIEGQVNVSTERNQEALVETVVLGAGQSARLDEDGTISRHDPDVALQTAWRSGKLVFSDQPLRDVIFELDRYRPGAIVFLSEALAAERFTGVIDLEDTDRALDAIEKTLPVEVIRMTDRLTFLRLVSK